MTAVNREELLGARTLLKTEEVQAPELGDGKVVIVREMSGGLREAYSRSCVIEDPNDLDEDGFPKRRPNPHGVYARLVIASVVDGEGKLLFGDKDGKPDFSAATVSAVNELGMEMIERICEVANRISKLDNRAKGAERKN